MLLRRGRVRKGVVFVSYVDILVIYENKNEKVGKGNMNEREKNYEDRENGKYRNEI